MQSQHTYTVVWKNLGEADTKEAGHQPSVIDEMAEKGALYKIDNGQKVEVLDWKGDLDRAKLRKVKILEGKNKGEVGYVPYTILREK